jgi:hypothetical protein
MSAIESAIIVTSTAKVVGGDDYTAGRLTTTFTYDPGCTGIWSQSRNTDDDPETERNAATRTLAIECQPLKTYPVYSPGICPEGMTIPRVIENRLTKYTKGGPRLWYGNCCSKYVTKMRTSERDALSDLH